AAHEGGYTRALNEGAVRRLVDLHEGEPRGARGRRREHEYPAVRKRYRLCAAHWAEERTGIAERIRGGIVDLRGPAPEREEREHRGPFGQHSAGNQDATLREPRGDRASSQAFAPFRGRRGSGRGIVDGGG